MTVSPHAELATDDQRLASRKERTSLTPRKREPAPRSKSGQPWNSSCDLLRRLNWPGRPRPPDPQIESSSRSRVSVDLTCTEVTLRDDLGRLAPHGVPREQTRDARQTSQAMTSIQPTRPGSVDRLLTIQQAAAYLNVPARTLGEKARLREVPFTRIFKHIRFTPADIAEIIARAARASWPRWTAPGVGRQVVAFSDASAPPLALGACRPRRWRGPGPRPGSQPTRSREPSWLRAVLPTFRHPRLPRCDGLDLKQPGQPRQRLRQVVTRRGLCPPIIRRGLDLGPAMGAPVGRSPRGTA